MTLPPGLHDAWERRFGRVGGVHPVGGGCIHPAVRVNLPDGPAFAKWGADAPGVFAFEADALKRLRSAPSGLRIPRVLAWSDADGDAPAWLLLEWLEPAPSSTAHAERLGRGLAALHAAPDGTWGWEADGWIGPLQQPNAPLPEWADFWWTRRLEPQMRRARDRGILPGTGAGWSELERRLPELLGPAAVEGPSLLHGDLWSGNVLPLATGEVALVDPASYYGHREVDLAMLELFGGGGAHFRTAYDGVHPLLPGYAPGRRAIYQLYPLLVHVHLFGGGYRESAAATLRTALAA